MNWAKVEMKKEKKNVTTLNICIASNKEILC